MCPLLPLPGPVGYWPGSLVPDKCPALRDTSSFVHRIMVLTHALREESPNEKIILTKYCDDE